MEPINFQALRSFLESVNAYHTALQERRTGDLINGLSVFLPEVGRLNQAILETRKANAPRYNLFEILKIKRYEAKVHTPFLVNLLSPTGSHAQGYLFYRTFAAQVFDKEKDARFLDFKNIHIKDEHSTGSLGFIDIWIQNRDPLNRYCIVIENKIDAGDQPDQLSRYYDYAKLMGYEDSAIRVFYLTKRHYGPASSKTIESEKRNRLETAGVLRYISYRDHILPWLNHHGCKAPTVNEVIFQYVKTIQSLI